MRESEKHQAEIEDECSNLESSQGRHTLKSAGRILTLLGLKLEAEENERAGGTRRRGRPRLQR